jgi:glutathione synthase/RimK-type ligase-like ATP-grasp enzyme
MKIGILGFDYGEVDPDGLVIAGKGRERGHETAFFTMEEITYQARRGGGCDLLFGGQPAQSFDAVISRAKLYGDDWRDRVEKLTLVSAVPGLPVFDPAEVWVTGHSKFLMAQRLAAAGLPVPPIRSATSLSDVAAACAEWGEVILKPSFGYGGTDVERIRDPEAEAGVAAGLLARYGILVCQPCWPTRYGEYRLNIGGHRACVAMLKLPPVGSWKCKSREGATYERIDPPADLAELALRAAAVLGITLAGVDVLPTPEGWVILEVNPIPGALDMLGEAARGEQLAGVYDWVEEQVAAGRCHS